MITYKYENLYENKKIDNTKLEVSLKEENTNLYNVFNLIDAFKDTNTNMPLAQDEKVSFVLEFTDEIPTLKLKDINITNITSVKRKILIYIVEFYPLNVLSKDIKISNFTLIYNCL